MCLFTGVEAPVSHLYARVILREERRVVKAVNRVDWKCLPAIFVSGNLCYTVKQDVACTSHARFIAQDGVGTFNAHYSGFGV